MSDRTRGGVPAGPHGERTVDIEVAVPNFTMMLAPIYKTSRPF
jgi:hypothetical protein